MQPRWIYWVSGGFILGIIFFTAMVLWLSTVQDKISKPGFRGPALKNQNRLSASGATSEWARSAIDRLQAEEYQPRAISGWIQAANRAQQLKLAFTAAGVNLRSRGLEAKLQKPAGGRQQPAGAKETAGWEVIWKTAAFGREGQVRAVSAAQPTIRNQRVEYRYPGLVEWYANSPQGLEQGFDVLRKPKTRSVSERATNFQPPEAAGKVRIVGRLNSGVTAAWLVPGKSLAFKDQKQQTRLIYQKLSVKDRKGRELPSELLLDQDQVIIAFQDAGAEYPVVVDPLLTVPSWTGEGDQNNAQFATSVAAAGDVNKDGFTDVIIGVPFAIPPAASSDVGMACVYFGSANGLSATADWRYYSDQENSWLGFCVAAAGDVNHDGYADVIVGAPYYDVNGSANTGRAFVFHGSAQGLSASPSRILDPNTADPNYVGAQYGYAVSAAGDVNGDGYGDVAVGAPYYHSGEGCFMVYHGSGTGVKTSPEVSSFASGNHGCAVACAGDVNKDGYSDVIVGSERNTVLYTQQGSAAIFFGSADGLAGSKTYDGSQANELFGHAVNSAGDIDHDGYDDVIIGAPGFSNGQASEGKVYVCYGGPTGPGNSFGWEKEGGVANAQFGQSVSSAGDVNHDNYADIVIGSPSYMNSQGLNYAGKVTLFHGSADGLEQAPAWSVEGDQASASFGGSIAGGDVNHDGFSEVVVGAAFYTHGQSNEGRAFLFANPTATPTTVPTIAPTSTPADSGTGAGGRADIRAFPSRLYPALGGHSALRWQQPGTGPVTVKLYTLTGRLVTTLAHRQTYAAGNQEIRWYGKDDNGQTVAAGIYVIHLQSGNIESQTKIAIIK